jgi:tRNA threonylcarbamoyl adenosine modification protein YeaZ
MALEFSTVKASMAVADEAGVRAALSWDRSGRAGQHHFERLPELLDRAECRLEDLDVFACGRGPGNYSGIRIAATTVQAWALPQQDRVVAISSGEVLAYAMLEAGYAGPIVVVGDARRNHVWMGVFVDMEGLPECVMDWELVSTEEFPARVETGSVVVSSEWSRLAGRFALRDDVEWIAEDRWPSAGVLARMVLTYDAAGRSFEPVKPIYMQPATTVPPRFA